MSVMYFLHVDLDAKYTEKNMSYILKNFSEHDCIFLAKEEDKGLVAGSYFLTLEQASSKMIAVNNEEHKAYQDILLVKCKDTYCNLQFYRGDNDLISVSLFNFSCPWGKNFWYGKEDFAIDFARYINWGIDITNNFSLLGLEMSSDHSDKWEEDMEKNCAIAVIDMGALNESMSGGVEGVKGSLQCIIVNGLQNGIVFFDEVTNQLTVPAVQKYYDILNAGFSVYLYAKKDGVSFKIEIKQDVQGYDGVAIYPLELYQMKRGYEGEKENIDVAFYVQRLLELCENFAIYELKTFFN